MSKHADRIEHARRIYVAALGTPSEAAARKNLELVIRETGTSAAIEVGPADWCRGAVCK